VKLFNAGLFDLALGRCGWATVVLRELSEAEHDAARHGQLLRE
jgi:hypothetical protein